MLGQFFNAPGNFIEAVAEGFRFFRVEFKQGVYLGDFIFRFFEPLHSIGHLGDLPRQVYDNTLQVVDFD